MTNRKRDNKHDEVKHVISHEHSEEGLRVPFPQGTDLAKVFDARSQSDSHEREVQHSGGSHEVAAEFRNICCNAKVVTRDQF
jgi:hypothetical protein